MKKLLLALAASIAAFVPIHAQGDPFSSSITIYVRTTATDANIYLWGTVGSQTNVQLTDDWPGTTLTKKTTVAGKEFYYLTCYDATEIKAILSNGGAQTGDLGPFTADTYLEYDGARAAKVIDPFEVSVGETFFVAPLNYKITSVEDKTVEVEAIDANAGVTDLVIPSEVNGYTVTSIEKQTFQNDHKLVSVVIPNTITYIGSQAFRNCTALTKITVPESVTSIGEAAFAGCTNLAGVYIKGQISTLNRLVFDQCNNLQSLVLPASLRSMSAYVFGVKVFLNARIIFFGSPAAIVKSDGETSNYNVNDVFDTSEIYVPGSLLSEYKETDVWQWRSVAFHTFTLTTRPAEVSALEAGKTQQLRVRLTCADSSGEDEAIAHMPEFAHLASDGIKWTSSDPAVATVSDQGLVTAVAPGTAHITAETPYSSAVFAACPVTVKEPVTGIDSPVSDSADALKVYAANGLVHVEGARPGAEVKVCDLSGRSLLTTRAHTFAAPARGLVLLTVASRTFKLTL